jgi:AraC-like DNA-binding protein
MDPLADLLDGPRAKGAFLLRAIFSPPWSLRIEDEAPLTLVTLVSGEAWIVPDRGDPARIGPGDLAVVRGPGHYRIGDSAQTAPLVVIHPGQHCTTLAGEPLADALSLGVRTWGTAGGGTVMLTGSYSCVGEVSGRLLAGLPDVLVLRQGEWDCPVLPVLADEMVRDHPGQGAVLDRLLDLVLVSALRSWLDRPDGGAPRWYRGYADPLVGNALRLLQNNPAEPWTVASLARAVGSSRAALARRFSDLVGEPPMTYLTGWRMALAADLLREPGTTIAAAARKVGYGTPFALSAAYKRTYGVSPRRLAAN